MLKLLKKGRGKSISIRVWGERIGGRTDGWKGTAVTERRGKRRIQGLERTGLFAN